MQMYRTVPILVLPVFLLFCGIVSASTLLKDDFQSDIAGTAPITTSNTLVLTDFDLYLPENAGGGNFSFNGFENTDYGNRAFNVYISPVDGAVNYFNGSAFVSTGLTVGLDQWVHVNMAADMLTKKFDITVSGVGTYTGADMLVSSGTVGALNMNAKLAYIDNLSCGINGGETVLFDDFQSDAAGTAPTADDIDPVIGAGDIGTSWKFTTPEPAVDDFQVLNNQGVTGLVAGSDNYLKLSNAGGVSANVWAELSRAVMRADDLDPVIGTGDIGTSWKFKTPEPDVSDFQVLNNQDVTGLVAGSDNYLKLSNAGGASANVWAELSDAELTTNSTLVQTDFDLYLPEDAEGGNFALNGFENTDYASRAFNVYISPVDGTVNYYDGSAFGSTGLTVGLDQWVHVTLVADMSAKKFDITVSESGTFSGADMLATSGTVAALNINAKLAYIDNLQVTVPELIPGDADGNGTVDAADAAILAANWLLPSGAVWGDGDFNDDGAVNDIDATILASNWSSHGTASVPEPQTIALLLSAVGVLLLRFYR